MKLALQTETTLAEVQEFLELVERKTGDDCCYLKIHSDLSGAAFAYDDEVIGQGLSWELDTKNLPEEFK